MGRIDAVVAFRKIFLNVALEPKFTRWQRTNLIAHHRQQATQRIGHRDVLLVGFKLRRSQHGHTMPRCHVAGVQASQHCPRRRANDQVDEVENFGIAEWVWWSQRDRWRRFERRAKFRRIFI